MIYESKTGTSYTKVAAFFLALSPILDPYILTEVSGIDLRLMYFVSFFLVVLITMSKKRIIINSELIILALCIGTLTVISFAVGQGNRSFFMAMKNISIWLGLSLFLGVIWKNFDYNYFMKWSYRIAILSIIILLIQFLLLNLGISDVFNGKIPFLKLSKYDDWSPLHNAAGAIRVHSIFQESSYLSIFMLPLFADSLQKHKYKLSLIILMAIFLSTSSVGVVGVILVIVYSLIRNEDKRLVVS